ncbi:MAG: FAD-binding oxidoreductase [Chromatiales bacterium]|nr:MAG: FAD-binding oxidoreductase [Chromatiales bacterium]
METVKQRGAPTQDAGAILDRLRSIVGPQAVLTEPAELEPHLTEWRGLYRGEATALVLPGTTAEAADVVAACAAARVAMVPQGGNSGLVGGAIAHAEPGRPEIILGAGRLNRIRELDAANYTITVEAGCVLADLQAAAEAAHRLFPLSLGAEGTCQIGGNISSNAGGINVLRYGNTRDLVLGLEVVLPDGRVFDGLRGLRKDNTGYDVKQLFIGAEGTLGFVTAATCKLYPQPGSVATAMVAVPDVAAAIGLHGSARDQLGGQLSAFELIARLPLQLVLDRIPGTREPLDRIYDWYVLLELAPAARDAQAQLEAFLAGRLESGAIIDGMLAQNEAQREALWRVRHSISEAEKQAGAGIKHDVAVPVSRVAEFIDKAGAAAVAQVPGAHVVVFGHLGDGNIHFNLQQPPGMDRQAFLDRWEAVSRVVHTVAHDFGGSFSAEHGVGAMKRDELARLRGGVEYELMRTLKRTLDPHGLMNPGKLFPAAD